MKTPAIKQGFFHSSKVEADLFYSDLKCTPVLYFVISGNKIISGILIKFVQKPGETMCLE